MRKLVLTALVATAGCSAAAQPTQPASNDGLATTTQGTTVTPSPEPGGGKEAKNLPKLRWVTPAGGGGDAGAGDDGGVTGDSGGGDDGGANADGGAGDDGGAIGDGGGGDDGGSGSGDGGTGPSPWHPLVHQPAFYAGTALLLTDGTVMVQDAGSSNWWKLTPDASGRYLGGTWTQLAPMPDGYAPLYFASAVLPDGRVIVEGGEYQGFYPAWTTQGAIYDPTKDQWTSVAPPASWPTIGDAQSSVLADGRFYLADCCSTNAAVLDPKALTWTAFGSGKVDINDEASWTLLPSGDLLTVDTNNTNDLRATEIFSPLRGVWTSAGDTPVELPDLAADGSGSHEMGPVLLRPDGTVFAVGATGHTAVYHSRSGRWLAGPDFPAPADEGQLDTADGPSVLLPNGHVLVVASPGVYNVPAHVFDFDGRALTEMPAPPGAPYDSSYNTNFLLLPSGEVMFTDFSNDVEIYAPTGRNGCGPDRDDWRPQIDPSAGLRELRRGGTYRISGTQLNGLSQAVAYGDDEQAATNYPLVRITNLASGHVMYARTHDHGSMGVAPGARSHTFFDVPATIETGASELVVVANGIPSEPVWVEVEGRGDASR